MVALLLRGWQILVAMLADVAEMLGPALPAIHWEADAESHLPAPLSRRTMVSDGIGEPLKLSLIFTLAFLSVSRSTNAPIERFLAPAAYEDSGVVMSMAPLMLKGLLCWMLLPLLSSGSCLHDRSAWVKHTSNTYMVVASLTSSSSSSEASG